MNIFYIKKSHSMCHFQPPIRKTWLLLLFLLLLFHFLSNWLFVVVVACCRRCCRWRSAFLAALPLRHGGQQQGGRDHQQRAPLGQVQVPTQQHHRHQGHKDLTTKKRLANLTFFGSFVFFFFFFFFSIWFSVFVVSCFFVCCWLSFSNFSVATEKQLDSAGHRFGTLEDHEDGGGRAIQQTQAAQGRH